PFLVISPSVISATRNKRRPDKAAVQSSVYIFGILVAVLVLAFIVALPSAVYRDHMALVTANNDLARDRDSWKAKASVGLPPAPEKPVPVPGSPNVELKKRLVKLIDDIRAPLADRNATMPSGQHPV